MTVNSNPNVSSTLSSEASVGFPLPLSKSLRVRALIDEKLRKRHLVQSIQLPCSNYRFPHLSLIHAHTSRNILHAMHV